MNTETWLPVPGYYNLYEVSSLGRIKSLGRQGTHHRILVQSKSRGYLKVNLCSGVNGEVKTHTIHRIVAMAFLGERPTGYQINHKNGDKHDNSVINLEYCTPSDNVNHAYKTGLHSQLGEKNACAKLTRDNVVEIGRLIKEGFKDKQIGLMFNVSRTAIECIRNGRRWTSVTGLGGTQCPG